MKIKLFYYNSNGLDRNLINLCGTTPAGRIEPKQKFYILPDRQMSFAKILNLPPVAVNKLRDMVRYQIIKIYPGGSKDVFFDFIPFKTEAGWKIVLYILKKKNINEAMGNKRFRGIVLPLQLLFKMELQSISTLIIFYPDMVEIWKFVNGIPERIERHDPEGFSVQDSLLSENEIFNPEKLMTIYPNNEMLEWERKNGRTKKFSETLDSIRNDTIYFHELRVTKSDKITPIITITAFIISLHLLAMTVLKQQDLVRAVTEVDSQITDVRMETVHNQKALGIIEKLDDELKQIRGNAPINVYNLLLRTRKVIDLDSLLLSFTLKGMDLTLTLRSRSALSDLESIKEEFGNVRASNIRTLEDGNKSYTVWVEIKQ